ncbi:hypothetical protein OKW43_000698 [Paraburkholderia sp. WC7.3g]|uniref:DUF2892 domain-containing protein n=1 Tax=Paraburkholderia podalyriae TaxID=1938811 RepID=A0ABR7PIM2_9BURK|nr:hypothetical protein [Paraburkholderia podalyriae]MBC8746224.1 hypothetical protein [Paraburkholderia podalyriae]
MKIIENGNFSSWFRILLWAAGITISVASYRLLSGMSMFVGVTVGMIVLATGTYAERANLLRLKPFDNSYKKARDSYKTKDDKQDE